MKLDFFKRMKWNPVKLFIPLLLCLSLVPLAGKAGMASTNFNSSINGIPPQIDATNFINSGSWNIETAPFPYQTSHTLNYTNTGTMDGAVGWEFDNGPLAGGGRVWSTSFFNDNSGTISASDLQFTGINNFISTVSYLIISATNIVNKGMLAAGPNGELTISGSEVNLGRSLIQITPVVGAVNGNSTSNFVADTAIYDQFWSGANSNKLTVTGSPWDGTAISKFTFQNVKLPCGATATEAIGPFIPQVTDSLTSEEGPFILTVTNTAIQGNPSGFTTTNFLVFSNEIRQAIFVFVNTNNFAAAIRFGPSLSTTNLTHPMAVQLATVSTNLVTGAIQTSTIYVVDSLGSVTNTGLLPNSVISPSAICTATTFRPGTVVVSRTDPGAFGSGSPGMGTPPATYLYDPATFTNFIATGVADVYSATVDNLAAEPPPGFSITNAPGRIHIYANDLDLTKTRISAAAEILIQATNLIGSTGAVMDCQNLSYNLGSTNGSLNVVNLAGQIVQRFSGTITEHSDLWTNHIMNVFPNLALDSTGTNWIQAPVTNFTEVDITIMVVNASGLTTTLPVIVQDLILHSTNMVVSDSMSVANSVLFDGQSLTIQGLFDLIGIQNWNSAIAPTLRFFTNNGVLQIPNGAHFGDDLTPNYAAFVNHGTISSVGQTINSDYLEINGGTNVANAANFVATCQTGLVINAAIEAVGDIQFFANKLQIDPSFLITEGRLNFTVTNSLSDGGSAFTNRFDCENGFNLFIKPATGDLLGTIINDFAFDEDEVDHVWAGHDFGTNAVGYSNNVAIGILNLAQQSSFLEPLYHFSGANAGNGLYVNNLDLSHLTDYTNELEIDPNLVIYFISAKLNTNVVITPSPSAEAFLNGQFGGHLRWAQGVTLSSNTSNTKISSSKLAGGQFQLNFTGSGSPNQTNVVEASTNLVNWVPIYTNIGALIFTDAAANGFPHRFYRVESSP